MSNITIQAKKSELNSTNNRKVEHVYSSENILHVTDTGVPRTAVLPTVSSSALSTMALDAGDTYSVLGALVTVNADSDLQAATRLSTVGPGVAYVAPGGSLTVASDAAITRVDIVGIGNVTSAAAGGVVIVTAMTIALALTHADQFNFTTAENVKTMNISMSNAYAVVGETVIPQATVFVEGFTHD